MEKINSPTEDENHSIIETKSKQQSSLDILTQDPDTRILKCSPLIEETKPTENKQFETTYLVDLVNSMIQSSLNPQINAIDLINQKENLTTDLNYQTQLDDDINWLIELNNDIYFGGEFKEVYKLNNKLNLKKIEGIRDQTNCAVIVDDKVVIGGDNQIHIVMGDFLLKSIRHYDYQEYLHKIIRIDDNTLLSCYGTGSCMTLDNKCNLIHIFKNISTGFKDLVRCNYERQLFATCSQEDNKLIILEVDDHKHIKIFQSISKIYSPSSLSLIDDQLILIGANHGQLLIYNIQLGKIEELPLNCDSEISSIKSLHGNNTNDQRISALSQYQQMKHQLFIIRTNYSIQLLDLKNHNVFTLITNVVECCLSDSLQLINDNSDLHLLFSHERGRGDKRGQYSDQRIIKKVKIPLK